VSLVVDADDAPFPPEDFPQRRLVAACANAYWARFASPAVLTRTSNGPSTNSYVDEHLATEAGWEPPLVEVKF
jgi:hypothetical protein